MNNSTLKNCNYVNLTNRSAFSVALFTKLTVNLTGLNIHSAREKFKYAAYSLFISKKWDRRAPGTLRKMTGTLVGTFEKKPSKVPRSYVFA